MTTDRYNQAMAILRTVLGMAPEEREAYVDHAIGGDEELRGIVRSLLSGQESATLVSAGTSTLASEPILEAPAAGPVGLHPRRIGSYTIVEVLGEGGMGMVYLAEQDRPKRRVALKVVRPGVLSSKTLRRFEHESQVLARLQHPGIAQIYEAGVAETAGAGQPFFAMEYVKGVPLTQFARTEKLETRAQLELFVKVCDAVAHAHQKGVIHRDLKPGNILVDAVGQPKVLDFGIARVTDADVATATMQTDMGQLLGTVPYMSPEQIAGDVNELDVRSDVYTLGVILYEMLSGRLPHEVRDKTIPEAVRIIGQEDPAPLTTINKSFRGDLATIVGKALEKDKARRYQSAADLAADIGRYLRDEPILARPPSTVYQLSKFARRNKGLVSGVAAALAVLAGASVVSSGLAIEANRGRKLAEDRGREATQAKTIAQEEAANAKATVDFLVNMFGSIDPDSAAGRDVTVREVLDAASVGVGEGMASTRAEASVRAALATSYEGIGRVKEAVEHAERALQLTSAARGEEHPETIDARRRLASAYTGAAQLDKAEALTKRTLEIVERTLPPSDPVRAQALGDWARVLNETGKVTESIDAMERAIKMATESLGPDHSETLVLRHNMATAMKDRGDFAASEAELRTVLEARIRVQGAEHSQTAFTMNNLGAVLQRLGKTDEALKMFEDCLRVRRKLLGDDHPATLNVQVNLSACAIQAKQFERAEPVLREAIAGLTTRVGEGHSKTLVAMANLAYLLEDTGREDEAETIYRRLIEVRKSAAGGRDPETWAPMNNLAMLLQRREKFSEAEAQYKDLLALCESTLEPGHYYTAIFRNNYGECLTHLKRYDEAERALLDSLPPLEQKLGPKHARTTKALGRLETLYEAWGKPEQALRYRSRLQSP